MTIGKKMIRILLIFIFISASAIADTCEGNIKDICIKAEKGDVIAQLVLGVAYESGNSVKQDYKKAIMWYEKAAIQGNANAQYSLGMMYGKGQGTKQDYNKAFKWIKKSADQDFSDAQYTLGLIYMQGQGVRQDG